MKNISLDTRKDNLIMLKTLEETNVELIDKLLGSEEIKQTNQLEISFMIQDSLMKTFVNVSDNTPLTLSNNTLRLLMLYKLNNTHNK